MISPAQAENLEDVLALLNRVNLPIEGVAENFSHFFIARNDGQIIGCIGMERHGQTGLLRSLAVAPENQHQGLGQKLTSQLLARAKADGVKDLVLLTTTAADFFASHFNFTQAERERFDTVFASSPEWHLPRCSSAVCLYLKLS